MIKAHSPAVLHTRKEVIVIFEEIKTRINIAYESLTQQSFENLLTILRVVFYLHPIPKFFSQINSIGSIPVTVFLENLLIKISMTKLKIAKTFKNWVITLLIQFTKTLPDMNTDNIKELKAKTYELLSDWNEDVVINFVNKDLESAVKKRDLGLISILIHFLRVFILYGEISKQISSSKNDEKWKLLLKNLIQGTKIVDNLQKEEIAVCVCYYLCLQEKKLCNCVLENGIINYLISTLSRQFISLSFGKKIIEFAKYLLLHLDNRYVDQINIPLFQKALALFSSRFDKQELIISIRDLVSILEQKVSVINYEQKLQNLSKLYEQFKTNIYASQNFFQSMHIINLYIENDRMGNLIVKYYPNLLFKILHEQSSPQIVKMISSFLSFNFKKGKFALQIAVQIVTKVQQIISNSAIRQTLLQNRKKILIDLVKIIRMILENREHLANVTQVVKTQQLQSHFWGYSDYANYIYQKELIELHRMLMGNIQIKDKQLEILKQLEGEIINKSKFNLNKVSWQLYEEIKFLQNLLNEQGTLQGYQLSKEIPSVVSKYINTTNHKVTFTLLENIENEESEHLRKEFNLICCKLLTKLLKNKKISQFQPEVKAKMKALTTSKDEFDLIYDMINNFFITEEQIQEQHEERQSILRASMRMQRQLEQQTQFTNTVRSLLYQYFRNEGSFDINDLEITQNNQVSIFIQELGHYQNEEDILKYLKIIYELTMKDSLCGLVYKLISTKIFEIYQALINRKEQNDEDIIIIIDKITLKFLKFHLKGLFNDQYDPDTVNLYLKYVGEIQNHFQFGFSEKRIQLLELIIEYLECNMIESHNEYQKMIKKESRSQFIRQFIDKNHPQVIGLSYSKLLSFNSDDEVHEDFWMLHKEHILRGLIQNADNVSYLKFLQIYISECQKFIYKEYQLQTLIQKLTELFIQQCTTADNIVNNLSTGHLSLRKLKYFSLVLSSYVERDDLTPNKNLLYSQEEALMKSLAILMDCSLMITAQSFKKFYIEQILVIILKTLTKLYRFNFIDKDIRTQHLSQYFQKLMEISNEDAINCVCELMRIFLLKRLTVMADNPVLISCKEYLQSLPDQGQQHIKACLRIEQLLSTGQSLSTEQKYYFVQKKEEEGDEDFDNFSTVIGQGSKKQKPLVVWIPIDDPIPEEESNINETEFQERKKIVKEEIGQQNIKILEQVWNQFELLEYLKNVLKSPQKYSIKKLPSILQDLQNIQYCYLLIDVFLDSERCYNIDSDTNSKYTLEDVQQNIINHIPGEICPLDSKYYEVLQKSQIGSDICLRKKGGMKATEILSKKMIDSKQINFFVRYLRNLAANIGSNNELKYLNGIKIEEVINSKITNLTEKQSYLKIVCDFIAVTADYSQLKNHYDVSNTLVNALLEKQLEKETKLSILKALIKLSKQCNKHKQISQKTKIVPYIVNILKDQNQDSDIFSSVSQLLANIIDYSEALIQKNYLSMNLEELLLGLLQIQVKKDEYCSFILSSLKILQFLTKNPSSSSLVEKGNFSSLLNPICRIAIKSNNLEVIGLEVGIISNILSNSKQLKQTVVALQIGGGLLDFFVEAAHYIPKIRKTQIFLDVIINIFKTPETIMKYMGQDKQILKILIDVLKYTETEMVIIEKWTKILVDLFLQSNCVYFPEILKTNIFFLATSSLKQNNFLTELTMDMNFRLMKELNMIEDPENLLIRHGFAGYMIQILRMKNIQTNDYIALLSMLKKLQEKSIFPPHLSTKLFQILLKNLHNHWNDELAIRSIILLKKIKKNVEITTEFSNSLFQFFNKFIIQCGKADGSYEYYNISREVICLVSYYINFNEDIKILFKSQVMVNLLKNWLKVFKSVVQDESHQTFRLWLYSVFNHQILIHDVCTINNNKLEEIINRFEKGWKVNLFRMDGSYKQAIFRLDRQKQEIISFKFPDGQIKSKYKLPLQTILLMYLYAGEQDFLFKESRFTRTINPFQHNVNYKNCLTIFSLIQEKFQVREISIELQSFQELQEIYVSLKIILNKMFERQKEQQVKVWIARSSKEIPINNFG